MNRPQNIAIAATFTAEMISDSLQFWLGKMGWDAHLSFAPYNQVFQQLLDPGSLFSTNENGLNVLLVRIEDWLTAGDKPEGSATRNAKDLVSAIRSFRGRCSTPCLLVFCPGRESTFEPTEEAVSNDLSWCSGLHLVRSAEIQALYAVREFHDPEAEALGHIPYTADGFAVLGTMVARKFYVQQHSSYKVLAVDCDEVLWNGVCGEVGPLGVVIDEPHRRLQQFLVKQHDSGMLICLSSKNNEEDVWSVFEHHPEMPLKPGHLVSWRINWENKSDNLKSLARQLNLGLDSFVFMDDNPLECAEVSANCPGVLVLQLPPAAGALPLFLEHIWALDRRSVTTEDRKRTELYRQNAERERLRESSLTLDEFLRSLALKVRIDLATESEIPRAAQLTQRTNQFNCATARYSEEDLRRLCVSDEIQCAVAEVSDRFGYYGLVGVLMFRCSTEAMVVENFLLSCRALGRGVEHRMLSFLQEQAHASGVSHVDVRFRPTAKNKPALDFLEKVGHQFRRDASDGELLFCFPADEHIEFTADKDKTTIDADARPIEAATGRADSGLMCEIGTELRDIEKLMSAIRAQRFTRASATTVAAETPRTPLEESIAGIWREVLGIENIGINDNFFIALGGDSLCGTQVISRLRHVFRLPLELRRLFEAPTIAQLAMTIVQQLAGAEQDSDMAGILAELQADEKESVAPEVGSRPQI